MEKNNNSKWAIVYNKEMLGKVFFKTAIDLIVDKRDFVIEKM